MPGNGSEESCSTVSDQVSCEVDKVMVKHNDEIASIHASIGLQEHVDSSRTGALPLGEPISHAFRSQKRNMAVLQLMCLQMAGPSYLQYKICQIRIAANGCNTPGVTWIGHHSIGAN